MLYAIAWNTPLTTGHAVPNEPYRSTTFGGVIWLIVFVWQQSRFTILKSFGAIAFCIFVIIARTHASRKFQFGNHSDLFSKYKYISKIPANINNRKKKNEIEKRGFQANDWYFTEIYIISMFSQSFFSSLLFCVFVIICCLCKIVVDLILSTKPAIIRNFSLNALFWPFFLCLSHRWLVALCTINGTFRFRLDCIQYAGKWIFFYIFLFALQFVLL